jgi:type IV pilus assembly protein PilC
MPNPNPKPRKSAKALPQARPPAQTPAKAPLLLSFLRLYLPFLAGAAKKKITDPSEKSAVRKAMRASAKASVRAAKNHPSHRKHKRRKAIKGNVGHMLPGGPLAQEEEAPAAPVPAALNFHPEDPKFVHEAPVKSVRDPDLIRLREQKQGVLKDILPQNAERVGMLRRFRQSFSSVFGAKPESMIADERVSPEEAALQRARAKERAALRKEQDEFLKEKVKADRKTAKAAPVDLDSLLDRPQASSGTGKREAAVPAAPAVERALPSADLMDAPEAATAETKRFKSEKRVAREMASASAANDKEIAAKPEKPAPEKAAAKKEEKALAPAEPAEIVFKKKTVHRTSQFREFLGSLKYFGMGKERSAIIENLAMMLNAGLPLIDSLKTLQMETRKKPMKKMLGHIVESVESGSPLWQAMEDEHLFSLQAIALVRIGEEAGNLAENMEYLAAQQEKDAALKNKIKMAMIYPAIVMTLMFVIVIGLGMFVLPNLISVLFSLNVKLPLATRMVIAFTNLFTTYGAVGVPSLIGGFILLAILAKFTPLRVVAQWIVFHIPGIGRLLKEATIARFGVILGGLMQAGVPLVDALRSLAEVTTLVAYKRYYFRLLDHINVGDSFAKSFQTIHGSQRILPISVQQLVVTGEKSGSLSKILLKVADIYEKKANDTAQKLPVILEPMLLLFIGSLVGTIAFSIIVPIYSIVGNVGGH